MIELITLNTRRQIHQHKSLKRQLALTERENAIQEIEVRK